MLSEMTRAEAESFVRENPDACMSYRRGDDGRVVFRPAPRRKPADHGVLGFVPSGRLVRRRPAFAAAAPVLAALAGCTSPLEAPEHSGELIGVLANAAELDAALETETETAYPSYQVVPEVIPCEPEPEPEPEREREPNNEVLVDGRLPELGNPGHYAGGISLEASQGHGFIAHAPPVSSLSLAEVEVEGADRESIEQVLEAHSSKLRACMDGAGLDTGSGELKVNLVIDATGKVLRSRATFTDGDAAPCIVRELRTWSFPEPEGPSAAITAAFSVG